LWILKNFLKVRLALEATCKIDEELLSHGFAPVGILPYQKYSEKRYFLPEWMKHMMTNKRCSHEVNEEENGE